MEERTAQWARVGAALLALAIFGMTSCAGNDESTPAATTTEDQTRTEDGATGDRFSDPLVQNTHEVAVQLCGEFGPKKTAKEYGAPADDLDAIARAYSMDSKEGPHRDAAHVGCLEGLMDF